MKLILQIQPAWEFVVHWSRWRRRHQARAKLAHYRRRNPLLKVQL